MLFTLELAVLENRVASLGVVLGLALILVVRYLRSPWRKLPPGPKGYPLIGNALQLGKNQWLLFSAWRKVYGVSRNYFLVQPGDC